MPPVHWQELFALSVSPLELILRGSVIYLFLFIAFRIFMRRDAGSVGIADILVLVLIADAAQNGMTGEYRSITDGVILLSTIIGWNLLFNWLASRSPVLRRLLEARELLLIENGKVLHRNLRRELITEEDLKA